jgi:hypothetical protein
MVTGISPERRRFPRWEGRIVSGRGTISSPFFESASAPSFLTRGGGKVFQWRKLTKIITQHDTKERIPAMTMAHSKAVSSFGGGGGSVGTNHSRDAVETVARESTALFVSCRVVLGWFSTTAASIAASQLKAAASVTSSENQIWKTGLNEFMKVVSAAMMVLVASVI